MATKLSLVAFAAICTVASTSRLPSPVLLPVPVDLHHLELQDLEQSLEAVPQRLNPTQVLEKLEQMLASVEEKIQQASDKVEATVEVALDKIENAALNAAGKWNATVQRWVEKTNEAGVDIQACLDGSKPLSIVVEALRMDAKACMAERLLEMDAAVENLKGMGPRGQAVLAEARAEVSRCNQQQNPVATGVCLASVLPGLHVKAVGVVANTAWLAGVAAVKAGGVLPLASLCATKATAGRAAEATKIVNQTVKCIKGKLTN